MMAAAISISHTLDPGGLLLVGCGKMGGAMLSGWLAAGAPAERIVVVEPAPAPTLEAEAAAQGFRLAPQLADIALAEPPSVLALAVKPQMMGGALPAAAEKMGPETLLISVAAGTTIAAFEAAAPAGAPIVRAMPNTPAAVRKGAIAIVGNAAATEERLAAAEALLSVVGAVVRLDDEAQIDAVTALSGSGPAYFFHLVEALAAAGEAEGLPPELAATLARATLAGAGALADQADQPIGDMRRDVTSPNGVTAAALEVLMHDADGLAPLMRRTLAAGAARSRALRA